MTLDDPAAGCGAGTARAGRAGLPRQSPARGAPDPLPLGQIWPRVRQGTAEAYVSVPCRRWRLMGAVMRVSPPGSTWGGLSVGAPASSARMASFSLHASVAASRETPGRPWRVKPVPRWLPELIVRLGLPALLSHLLALDPSPLMKLNGSAGQGVTYLAANIVRPGAASVSISPPPANGATAAAGVLSGRPRQQRSASS